MLRVGYSGRQRARLEPYIHGFGGNCYTVTAQRPINSPDFSDFTPLPSALSVSNLLVKVPLCLFDFSL